MTTMATEAIAGTERPSGQSLLLDLAQALHTVAVPSDVVVELVDGAARRLGLEAHFVVMQSWVGGNVVASGGERVWFRPIPFDPHWRLERLGELLRLARGLVAGRVELDGASRELREIVSRPNPYPQSLVVVAYSSYSAAVAARIGGGWLEVVVAFAVGLLAGFIHASSTRHEGVDLEKSFLGGLLGGLAVLVFTRFLPPFDFGSALFGGTTLLVPAMVIAIGTHELANGALEAGSTRLAYGLFRFLMLAVGIAAAMRGWSVFAPLPGVTTSAGLPHAVVVALLVTGGAALVVCLQAPKRDVVWVVAAVLIAYEAQELTKLVLGERGAPFAAAFTLGAAAYWQARIPGHNPATMLIPGLLQLAPGFLGTRAVLHLLAGEGAGHETFFGVMFVALQLVTGLLAANLLFGKHLGQGAPASGTTGHRGDDPASRTV